MVGVPLRAPFTVLLFLLAGCVSMDDGAGGQTPAETSETDTQAFPQLMLVGRQSFSEPGQDPDEGNSWLVVEHVSGPCITPQGYVWELSQAGARVEVTPKRIVDGRVGATMVEWCIHQMAAFDAQDVEDGPPFRTVTVYEKASGGIVFQQTAPPGISLARDEANNRLTVNSADSDARWDDFSFNGCAKGPTAGQVGAGEYWEDCHGTVQVAWKGQVYWTFTFQD